MNVASTQAGYAKAQADLAAANARFAQVKSQMSQAAVNAYMHGGNTSMIEQLVKSNGKDLAVRKTYVEAAAADQNSTLDALKAARQDLQAQQANLKNAADSAKSAAASLASQKAAIDAAISAQQATLNKVKGDVAALIAQQQAAAAADAQRRAQQALSQAATAKPRAKGPAVPAGPPPPVGHGAGAAVAAAESVIGDPYVYGAAGPSSFDCSGLTMWAWAHGGVSLPHSSQSQYASTTHVAISAVQPGDLLFYYSDIHHVAMYVGGGMMVEAPHTGANVREVPMRLDSLVGAGRPG
ncbi:MAG TPA: NlpC/P60 family protein [Acidimicrobiales bacterium]|nr:NlpC/P60 family protein [Acidimicrobiales bacterium]